MQAYRRRLLTLTILFIAAALIAAPAFGQQDPPPGGYEYPAFLLGAHGDPGATEDVACQTYCHDNTRPDPVWFGAIVPPGTGWGTQPTSVLCYSCHDAGGGFFPGRVASNMLANAYDDVNGSHYSTIADIPEVPDGAMVQNDVAASGLPYINGPQIECMTCHNPHDNTNRAFLRAPLAELCSSCHGGRANDNNHSRTHPGGSRSYSTHPTKMAMAGPVTNRNMKTEATMDARLRVSTPPPDNYQLGGHLDGPFGDSGLIDCGTCHAVHGPTLGTAGLTDLLAIENYTESSAPFVGSALCEGCHFGGLANGDVGTYVAGPGEYGDHPVDDRSANWAGLAGLIPAPPINWTFATPNLDRGAQPHLTVGTPACSSCHDIHGGIANTPLLRGPAPATYNNPDPWTFSSEDWCFSCHDRFTSTPMDANHDDPQVACGSCHAADSAIWTAHNGFWTMSCTVTETPEVTCDDGADNDCDGLTDIDDPDCGTAPPWISDVLMNGDWYINVDQGTPIDLTADVTDLGGGDHVIAGAEYFLDTIGADGTGTAMSAADGSFDSSSESVESLGIDTSGWSGGGHVIYVHGYDANDGWGPSFARSLYITTTLHVDSFAMTTASAKGKISASATVQILDNLASPVAGATVSGHWEGLTTDFETPTATAADGTATFDSDAIRNPSGTFTFVVDDVSKTDYVYNAPVPPPSGSIDYPPAPVCTDSDGDLYSIEGGDCGEVDCQDADPDVNPGAVEDCFDGIDNNCNGLTDDADPVCGGGGCSNYTQKALCNGDPNCDWLGSPKSGSCQDVTGCTITEDPEQTCDDGADNDCDGLTDTEDPDCPTGGTCDGDGICESGEDCSTCPSDCDGVTGGKPANRYCCGNGIVEGPEGDGTICDGIF